MSQESRRLLEVVAVRLYVCRPSILVGDDDVRRVLHVLESFKIVQERGNPFSLKTVGASAPPVTWQMASDCGRWDLTITFRASAIRTITHAEPEGTFRRYLLAILGALGRAMSASSTRVGLRNIHLLRLGEDVRAYRRVLREKPFDESANAWADDDGLAGIPSKDFSLDGATRVICRHGFTLTSSQGDGLAYLLDTEIFHDDVNLVDSAPLCDAMNRVHDGHLCVIRTALTDEALHAIDWAALSEFVKPTSDRQ
jgi:hypothetical protein